jgi:hypothetical protein
VENLAKLLDMDKATVLQLFDNSCYMAGRPGRVKLLPAHGSNGRCRITGPLLVADKPGIKDLLGTAMPLIRALGSARKLVLKPLAQY